MNHYIIALCGIILLFSGSMLSAGEQISGQPGISQSPLPDSAPRIIYQTPQPVKEIPLTKARIKFDEPDWNFGSIQKGAEVSHNYWFSNNGTENLVITRIKPACGCTTTKSKGITVPPGGRGFIDISFNSGKFNNVITKGITVETNDALNPYLELRFTATINNPLQILETAPLEANFKSVLKGQPAEMILKLKNVDSTQSKIDFVEMPDVSLIKISPGKLTLKPQGTAEIKFSLNTSNFALGPFVSSLTIEAQGKPESRITIPIIGTIVEQLPATSESSIK
jgi:hypothetical protein